MLFHDYLIDAAKIKQEHFLSKLYLGNPSIEGLSKKRLDFLLFHIAEAVLTNKNSIFHENDNGEVAINHFHKARHIGIEQIAVPCRL